MVSASRWFRRMSKVSWTLRSTRWLSWLSQWGFPGFVLALLVSLSHMHLTYCMLRKSCRKLHLSGLDSFSPVDCPILHLQSQGTSHLPNFWKAHKHNARHSWSRNYSLCAVLLQTLKVKNLISYCNCWVCHHFLFSYQNRCRRVPETFQDRPGHRSAF